MHNENPFVVIAREKIHGNLEKEPAVNEELQELHWNVRRHVETYHEWYVYADD